MVKHIIFVHGWSVHHTDTYGELPERLAAEVPGLKIQHLHLGKYISFRDEVRMIDVARAMESAVISVVSPGETFAAITHSTGGPVVRTWWHRFYLERGRSCPMTHAIHLAAAHAGSALAQLGKGKLGRIKSFVESIEPGEGILDWLELGSQESLALQQDWVRHKPSPTNPVFHFCLTGQQIDRKFYDHLNSYTGEMGSDGTVRVASANLNTTRLRLIQEPPTRAQLAGGKPSPLVLDSEGILRSPTVPFCLIPGVSHVGPRMGILRSVKRTGPPPPVVHRILEALHVRDEQDFQRLTLAFQKETRAVQSSEAAEVETQIFHDRIFFHDPCAMLIIKVRDEDGCVPGRFRILFNGAGNDPNRLPEGFLLDRQQNIKDRSVITFFFNCAALHGSPAIRAHLPDGRKKLARPALPGLMEFGFRIEGDPLEGFAHYHPAEARATPELLKLLLRSHETTVLEVVLKRIVRANTFSFSQSLAREDFRKSQPGDGV